MSSNEETASSQSCTGAENKKRKAASVSMAATQNCIAASIANVIGSMVNTGLQHQCIEMLQVDNFQQVQGKILQHLQQIDFDILEEQDIKDKAKLAKTKQKAKNAKAKKDEEDKLHKTKKP